MSRHYADIAFTEAVSTVQERYGSRSFYDRRRSRAALTQDPSGDALSEDERAYLSERDSFYLATVSATGWPYVQFRGGPPGFLQVIDDHTLGWADFRGNLQYVSTGNLAGDDRVAPSADVSGRGRLGCIALTSERQSSPQGTFTACRLIWRSEVRRPSPGSTRSREVTSRRSWGRPVPTDPDPPLTHAGASPSVIAGVEECRGFVQQALAERFDQAARDGQLPSDADTAALARFYSVVIQGIALDAQHGGTREQLRGAADTAIAAWPT